MVEYSQPSQIYEEEADGYIGTAPLHKWNYLRKRVYKRVHC